MKAALDIELSVRDYLNEGGKLLVSGKYALFAQSANGAYFYNPNAPASRSARTPTTRCACRVLNDFLQYWLGAYTYIDGGGTDPDGSNYPLAGIADPFTGWDATPRRRARTTPRRSCPRRASCRRRSSRGSDRARPRSTGRARAPRRSSRTPATGICSAARPTSRTSG